MHRENIPVRIYVSACLEYRICSDETTGPEIEESILVIRGLGIQTSTSSSFYFCSSSTRFIPTTQIQDIIIHEAFKGFEVKFYLAVIVEGESEVGVVFPVSFSPFCSPIIG